MGTCHGAYLIDGEILGDPLDIKMLEFSQYQISNTNSADIKFRSENPKGEILEVLKTFDFESGL